MQDVIVFSHLRWDVPHVYCFPISVEREHFALACDPALEHDDQSGIAHLKLGFFGVIDERVGVALIKLLADTHPEWQIILVGPVVKIDPNTLPKRKNIHYIGQRRYALNEATRYLSPTKTLEYMAAGKPIVSTPVTDVADSFGEIVECAAGAEFVRACERTLALSATERARRIAAMRAAIEQTSWHSTAAQMPEIMQGLDGSTVGELSRASMLPDARPHVSVLR